MNRICGTSSTARLAVGVLVGLALLVCGSGVAAAGSGQAPKPKPQTLWRSYPLDTSGRGQTGPRGTVTTPAENPVGPTRPTGTSAGDSDSGIWILLLEIAAAILVAGAFAALALRVRPWAAAADAPRVAGGSFRSMKGEAIMANNKLKMWARQLGAGADEPPKQEKSGGEPPQQPAEAPVDSAVVRRVFAATSSDADPATHEPAGAASADLDEVGAEVGSVLRSAQEAAERIRRAAHEEATKMRGEAKAAAAAEVEEGRRVAEADRADGRRVRAEADAYAEKVRAAAERESKQTLQKARLRLERADQAVAEKLREAEGNARHRREALEAESERYRDRLEKMLGVFHGMSSQLEELLEKTTREGHEATDEPAEGMLEDALRPSATYRSA